ncbi:MAG TPA: Zn-ribbon domain-containing OB-fold protein [Rubrivivax sp.]|nr:Zn-ribbon domain-containing OB-fold protein [Rubrivivax sp.]
MSPSTTEPLVIPAQWHVRYNYPAGETATRFFAGLRERRILASRCSRSGLSYLPPRAYCERSFEPCDGWVEAGHEGTIEAATIVSAAFENLPPPPYAIAYVRLDGVDTALLNFVRGLALDDLPAAAQRLRPGARVRVVFEDEPQGRITDFHYVLLG